MSEAEMYMGETMMDGSYTESINEPPPEITFRVNDHVVTMKDKDGELVFEYNQSIGDAAKAFLRAVAATAQEMGYGFGKVREPETGQ